MELLNLSFDQVSPDPEQPRETFDRVHLDALKRTMREHGQVVPARVRAGQEKDSYIIVDGECRFRALVELHEEEPENPQFSAFCAIACDDAEADALPIQFVANEIRRGLNPFEQVKAFRLLMSLKYSEDDLRAKLGMTAGNFRYLKQLSRSPCWLQELGRSVTLEVPVLSENGLPELDDKGCRKTKKQTCNPLPLTHLIRLVRLWKVLSTYDAERLKASEGKHKPIALKLTTKLAKKAALESWSVSQLGKSCERQIAKVEGGPDRAAKPVSTAPPFVIRNQSLRVDLSALGGCEPKEREELACFIGEMLEAAGIAPERYIAA